MIFYLHGQPLVGRIERRPLRHGPGLQDTFHFKAEVIVQPRRVVLLHDEAIAFFLFNLRRRLGRLFEAPFSFVFLKGHTSAILASCGGFGCTAHIVQAPTHELGAKANVGQGLNMQLAAQSSARNGYNPAAMNREFPEFPLVGVGSIIIENDRVLLVKRAHPPIEGQWSIPGGVLEVGELIREAAIREVREETGLIVEPGDLLGVYDRILRNPEKRVQYHYVLIDFLCSRAGGELHAASDAAEVRWFRREELPALNLAEDTQDVIRKGFAKLAR